MAILPSLQNGNITISLINAFRGAANSNTSLKTAELAALGDAGSTGFANPGAAGALCVPNQLYDDVSSTLRSLTGTGQPAPTGNLWQYAPANGNTRTWGMARMSEFATAYTGIPTIQAASIQVSNIWNPIGYMIVTVGGEYTDAMSVYVNVNSGTVSGGTPGSVPSGTALVPGAWTTLPSTTCYLYGVYAGANVSFFVKDKYGCGNNYSLSTTRSYP